MPDELSPLTSTSVVPFLGYGYEGADAWSRCRSLTAAGLPWKRHAAET